MDDTNFPDLYGDLVFFRNTPRRQSEYESPQLALPEAAQSDKASPTHLAGKGDLFPLPQPPATTTRQPRQHLLQIHLPGD